MNFCSLFSCRTVSGVGVLAGTAGRAAPTRPSVPGSGSRELPLPRGKSSGSFWEVAPAAGTGLGTAGDPRAARPRLLLGAITFWACLTLTPGEEQSSHAPQVPVPSLWASSGSGDMSPTRLHGPGTVVVPAPLPGCPTLTLQGAHFCLLHPGLAGG